MWNVNNTRKHNVQKYMYKAYLYYQYNVQNV